MERAAISLDLKDADLVDVCLSFSKIAVPTSSSIGSTREGAVG
jgi:hypothetical protein